MVKIKNCNCISLANIRIWIIRATLACKGTVAAVREKYSIAWCLYLYKIVTGIPKDIWFSVKTKEINKRILSLVDQYSGSGI